MKNEVCDERRCADHSGVEWRLRAGNIVFGSMVVVLIAVIGWQAREVSKTSDNVQLIREAIVEIRAAQTPQIKLSETLAGAVDDLRRRVSCLEIDNVRTRR